MLFDRWIFCGQRTNFWGGSCPKPSDGPYFICHRYLGYNVDNKIPNKTDNVGIADISL